MQNRQELLSYLDSLTLIVLAGVFFLFPLLFTFLTSDAFVLPKQILVGAGLLLTLLFFGIKTLIEGKLRLRSTPFDLPLFLFGLVIFISSFLSINRASSLISFIPLLFAVLLYFVIVNTIRDRRGILVLAAALLLGTALTALLSLLSFFGVYVLPFKETSFPSFTPVGSLLDQALLFGMVLPLAAYLAHPVFSALILQGKTESHRSNPEPHNVMFGVGAVVITAGLIVTLYQLATTQQPLILPFWEGFRIALGAISRDTTRALQSFLFGSGYGTFQTDFTRFKEVAYNSNPKLWSFSFFRSSTFIFELLATTGFLGLLSYLFIGYRVLRERWFFLPLVLIGLASFFLPFTYIMQAMLFMLLGLFALIRAQQNPRRYPMRELYLVALDQGLLSARPDGDEESQRARNSLILPIVFSLLLALLLLSLGYFSTRFILSDITFKRSLDAFQANQGSTTYQLQREAITMFPYRDTYYLVFSQTNLALANNLAAAQPQGSSPSAQTQQMILTLIQQSINSGRSAVTLSPLTPLNWNNLSSVYRSLIGFGQNADQFAILTNQQALALDPNNPQQYINLGGIYYQLGQWEEAQRNFQAAITLKPDYANAYYNLGHALESKGDLQNALAVYQTVRSLVTTDKESFKKINDEIAVLEKKIGSLAKTAQQNQATEKQNAATQTEQPPLGVNQPATKLPERNPRVRIPGVTITPTPTETEEEATSPTPTPNQ